MLASWLAVLLPGRRVFLVRVGFICIVAVADGADGFGWGLAAA